MQLGFVIDHSRCIGCHACTVACKSENDVPLGSFRTWVKYTETGTFPQVRRSFAVLRCNQCSNAPCVTICPVAALEKRSDGIVDIDPDVCVGCKACMQACPYDALYIHEGTGTAQKCHFCAHRTDRGLAPACAVVCPTEAIIPGDFADPSSRVARMKQEGDLTARKTEAGTGPNVWYREADPAGLDPARTNAAGGYLWANAVPGARLDADTFEAMEQQAGSRTTYDVAHEPLWGGKVSGYLFTKSIAAGLFLAISAFLPPHERGSLGLGLTATGLGAALLALLVTTALLVADLKRPERFLKILFHANWSSWLARGSIVLMAYGGILSLWFLLVLIGRPPAGALAWGLNLLGFFLAVFAAVYTAFLFRQAKGRVLWLSPVLGVELIAHAVLAGFASLLLLAPFFDGTGRPSFEPSRGSGRGSYGL